MDLVTWLGIAAGLLVLVVLGALSIVESVAGAKALLRYYRPAKAEVAEQDPMACDACLTGRGLHKYFSCTCLGCMANSYDDSDHTCPND